MKNTRVKGARDLSGQEMAAFRRAEGLFTETCARWGYEEVRTPTIEYLHMFTQTGTLTFSDGSSIDVADIANDGSMKTIRFDAKAVTWVRFKVTGGRGSNRGLSEIEVLSDTVQNTHTLQLR